MFFNWTASLKFGRVYKYAGLTIATVNNFGFLLIDGCGALATGGLTIVAANNLGVLLIDGFGNRLGCSK